MLFFFPGNIFFMIDPVGDTSSSPCGGPGLEYGAYSYTNNVLRVTGLTLDTNGCAGLSQSRATTSAGMALTLSANGATASINENNSIITIMLGH
jgi:hypothetical protein